MKKQFLLTFLFVLLLPAGVMGRSETSEITPLDNEDILLMVQQEMTSEQIVAAIKVSRCTFDIFPPVLEDLKRRGVPDSVLRAMVDAPYGPSTQSVKNDPDTIYHYAEQLEQSGVFAPSAGTTAGSSMATPRARARAARARQRN